MPTDPFRTPPDRSDDPLRAQLQATLGSSYNLERELGGGGMSRTLLAEETALGRRVVVKVLPAELAGGVNVERFNREILVAARLQNPHIVPVLTAGQVQVPDGALPFYTMPYVEGESLRGRLARGPLAMGDAVSVLRDVARALAYAHDRGVVHRDIKPDNVLLSAGSAVVTDFGIAKAISAARDDNQTRGETLTALGTSIGTPAYMAPEQAAGDPATDHRADIYAFGCMAYELLAGHPPFHSLSPQRLLAAHMGERPRPVQELRPDTPPALAALVMRCLEKDPDQRPQRATHILAALDAATSSAGGQPAMPAILLGGRNTLGKALAIYAVAFIAAALIAKAAIVSIGLPDWVFPGTLIVMSLGLPVILFTGYTQYAMRKIVTRTPTLTPGGSVAAHGTMATIALKASPHVSWRRSALGGIWAVAAFVLLIGGYMLLRQLGIGPAGSLFAAHKLAADDRVLVADFTMAKEDSALGPILVEAVRAAMSQSSAIHLLAPDEVSSTLVQMRRDRSAKLDADVAREVALRSGAKAILGGRIARVGTGYALSLELASPQGGALLASYQATADGPKDLLNVVDQLTHKLRGRMGESLKSVQQSVPLQRATTSSLEALRKYSEGMYANDVTNDYPHAVKVLREAVAIDSTFALAWRKLSMALGNGGYPVVSRDSALREAARFADRLPDREKYLILGQFYSNASMPEANRAKALAAYQAAYAADSTNSPVSNQLTNIYAALGQYDSSARYARRDLALDHNANAVAYLTRVMSDAGQSATALHLLDSLDRADTSSRRNVRVLEARQAAVYGTGDRDSARVVAEGMRRMKSPRAQLIGVADLMIDANTRGELARALQLRVAYDSMYGSLGNASGRLGAPLVRAQQDAWYRDRPTDVVRRLDSMVASADFEKVPPVSRPYLTVAQLYAESHAPDKAEQVLARAEREAPQAKNAFGQANILALRGEVALVRGNAREAIDLTRRAAVASDGTVMCDACVNGVLARAFLSAGEKDSALAHYEAYLAVPTSRRFVQDQRYLADTELHLGELYEARSDWKRAVQHYAAFVELWKHADPELQPKVAEVRQRLDRLRKRAS